MNIVVGSAFRNMSGRVNRYFQRVHALKEHVGSKHPVRIIAVEGDSTDETDLELAHMAELWEIPTTVVKHNHGLPPFGSTEKPERLKTLTGVSNKIFRSVLKKDDVLVYVESDLLWEPHDVGSLVDFAMDNREGFDIFAPMVWAGEAFYDIWGFRGLDGERFGPFAPYHESLPHKGFGEISSAGSCLVMRAEIAREVKNESDDALVGWCEAARKRKYKIACALNFRVDHP